MSLFRERDYDDDLVGLKVVEGEVVEVGDDMVVPLPEQITSEIKVSFAMDQVSRAVERISEQVFGKDRGTMEYDGIADVYVLHLVPNDLDKAAVAPLFEQALDIWMVIDAHARDNPFQGGVH